ncbi:MULTISPECIES: ATP-grasp domain-containing protein [unclassified Bartonella]|uniref:ATP-grasp domain-containing protein n=1 Tax=unclassified Bartonella TaxID=2645622 RepID=UPI0023607533|nr:MULTISPECIES: ATP-grasp domain-containing protein [unclassified Bartonella]
MSKPILIIDPFSTGALYGPALQKLGYACYGVVSQPTLSSHLMLSYQGEGMAEVKLHSVEEIKQRFPIGAIAAVVAGAEGGIYCTEQLAAYYGCPGNNPSTTDWRRKKAAMQKRLHENGLSYIRSKILTKDDCTLDDFESHSGYVVKPNASAGSDGVLFFSNREEVEAWISGIDWKQKNIFGMPNEAYLLQERLVGEEYIVDAVVKGEAIKICSLSRYKKGLHNGSAFVYESLDVLDAQDSLYADLISYAKKCISAVGIEYGPAHMEIMQTAHGPVMIEVGARLHGGIAPSLFVHCYEDDLLKSSINLIAGVFSQTPSRFKKKGRILFLINKTEGLIIKDMNLWQQKLHSCENVVHFMLFFKENEPLPLTIDLNTCPAIIAILGENDDELSTLEDSIRSSFL